MVKTHVRRTPEQRIADLEAEIAKVRERAAAKEAKSDPAVQAALSLARAVKKAEAAATEAKDDALQEALSGAQAAVTGYLESKGLSTPKRGKGPRKAG